MLIELYDQEGDGIIIPSSSGTTWTNQVGGIACFHPKMEGIYIPLGIVKTFRGGTDPIESVCKYDPDQGPEGTSYAHSYDEMLVWQFLKSIGEHDQFRPLTEEEYELNRRLLGDDFYLAEAWVPVFVLKKAHADKVRTEALRPLAGMIGILTYPNSD